MKRRQKSGWEGIVLGCFVLCAAAAHGQEARVAFPGGAPGTLALGGGQIPFDALYRTAIENRLGVGLRITSFQLRETSRPADEERLETFVGYVNELHEEDKTGVWPVITYRISDYLGLELTWGEVAARTFNFNTDLSDGVVRMNGPIVGLTAQYPIRGYLCPFVGLGYAPWSASFDHEPWWRLGWLTPEQYEDAGSPPDQAGERPRLMVVEDDSAIVYSLGVTVHLHRYVDLDIMVRRMSLDSKVRHYRGDPLLLERVGSFPLDHTTVAMGLHGVF